MGRGMAVMLNLSLTPSPSENRYSKLSCTFSSVRPKLPRLSRFCSSGKSCARRLRYFNSTLPCAGTMPCTNASKRTVSPRPTMRLPSGTRMRVLRGTGSLDRNTRLSRTVQVPRAARNPASTRIGTIIAMAPNFLNRSVGTMLVKSTGRASASVSSTKTPTIEADAPGGTAPGRASCTAAMSRLRNSGFAFSTINASSSSSGCRSSGMTTWFTSR